MGVDLRFFVEIHLKSILMEKERYAALLQLIRKTGC